MKFKRWQEPHVEEALRTNRVVILAGPRQCGKTTTANVLLEKNEGFAFYSLDDAEILAAAKTDPRGFLQRNCKTMIIDEIQRAPELLTAIKKTVDFNSSYG
jgi:predicted AAA+ superfamily ATPase